MSFVEIVPPAWEAMFVAAAHVGERPCAIERFMFTYALLTDVSFSDMAYDYSARYCYERFADAANALAAWDGQSDPPGPWIKEKVSERLGPGAMV